jgi:general secretion pathway protein D
MRPLVSTLLAAIVALEGFWVVSASGVAQVAVPSASQTSVGPSVPFDLEPQVERATFELRRPSPRVLYDAIAEAYGVQLLYDPDLSDVPLLSDFRIQDAAWKEALEAAGSISDTFVVPLDSRRGLVVPDTLDKRAEYEQELAYSFRLDDVVTSQQMTEISTALRTMVDLRRVSDDPSTNSITVVGRPHQIAVADKLFHSLQKPVSEVLLEVEVWEIGSRRAREIGLIPPQSARLLFAPAADAASVPLRSLGQPSSFYGISLSGLTALLRSSSSLVRSHQTVHLRASDAQHARLLIGERYPVITSLISSTIQSDDTPTTPEDLAAQGFIPGIQYYDLGVILEATPFLHANRELTLQLDFEITGLGTLGDNGQPSFTNRHVTAQVRLRDGEAFLVSGLLSSSDKRALTGYPGISRIPLIGWLFGSRDRQKDETELLILIRPHTIRPDASEEFASRTIYFGKELTGLPAAPQPPQPPQTQPGAPPQPVPPGVQLPPGVLPPGAVPQPGVPVTPGEQPTPQPGFPFPGFPPGVFPQGVVPQQQPQSEQSAPSEPLPEEP